MNPRLRGADLLFMVYSLFRIRLNPANPSPANDDKLISEILLAMSFKKRQQKPKLSHGAAISSSVCSMAEWQ
jgi:hypothetical protein